MKSVIKKTIIVIILLLSALTLHACGVQGQSAYSGQDLQGAEQDTQGAAEQDSQGAAEQDLQGAEQDTQGAAEQDLQDDRAGARFEELTLTGNLNLEYATQFSVEEYGDYRLVRIENGEKFLVVPENEAVPENVPKDITVIRQPLGRAYLVSTSVMDLIRELGAVDDLRFSGTKESDWYIAEAVEAMADGRLLYAGKYSAPDYELLISEGCDLAIENTMIYHSPEVKEKLEELGIPVLVEQSSHEKHPLGRLEWIKLYGILFGKEDRAKEYFDNQLKLLESVINRPDSGQKAADSGKKVADSGQKAADSGQKVAFFYVNSMGAVNVRKPGDYISEMIELSGGEYALRDVVVESDNALSTMNMQMEDFFLAAKDADILIYNSTIEAPLYSIDDLIGKNKLFSQFAAVQSGRVYCTGKHFFQESTGMAEFMLDLNAVIEGQERELVYLTKLE